VGSKHSEIAAGMGFRDRSDSRCSGCNSGSENRDSGSEGPNASNENEGSKTVESEDSEIVTSEGSWDSGNSISVCPRASSEHTDSEMMVGENSCDSTDPSDSADSRSGDRNLISDGF